MQIQALEVPTVSHVTRNIIWKKWMDSSNLCTAESHKTSRETGLYCFTLLTPQWQTWDKHILIMENFTEYPHSLCVTFQYES